MLDITLLPSAKVPLIYDGTTIMSTEWYRFFWNVYGFTGSGTGAIPVNKGGTGLTSIGNHQIIIGNSAGAFEPAVLAGTGITIDYATGTVTLGLGTSGVTPGTYGSASSVGQIIVNQYGVITLASNVSIGINGNQITSGTVGVGFGGTGQISYTDGQLLIGNSTGNTLSKATLTAGSGISITNGPGAITISAASSAGPAPVTKTADFTVAAGETWIINNKSASTCTVTLPSASANTGRILTFQNYQNQLLVSASSNVVPLSGGSAGTGILLDVAGNWATMVSNGTNWVIMQAAPNNIMLV